VSRAAYPVFREKAIAEEAKTRDLIAGDRTDIGDRLFHDGVEFRAINTKERTGRQANLHR